ncbi:DUF962 domain-containing protein [Roseomonas sp. HF4]|uniref:DUF962 domain-containing protein n=1 Tax=Roseomonas sp. HF4 TaxID=2562313 RepID=UPI0010C03089|nr:DUF962 domain-containing protein [Roseomonas sp. HF4]
MAVRIATYAEFWPYYLRQHAQPATRTLHLAGTALGILLMLAGLLSGSRWLLPLAAVAGYGLAWVSHLLVERHRPATFTYPAWSFVSDLRMTALMASGRLGPELRKAGVGPGA